jgi:hypothetical protein
MCRAERDRGWESVFGFLRAVVQNHTSRDVALDHPNIYTICKLNEAGTGRTIMTANIIP